MSSRRQAEEYELVLTAVGISGRTDRLLDGDFSVRVAAAMAPNALDQLDAYDRENAQRRSRPVLPDQRGVWALEAALGAAALLVLVYGAQGRFTFGVDWTDAGAAEAAAIRAGALWRAVTALTLHGDVAHLASNLFGGAVASILVARLLGTGVTWLALVVAGMLGNILAAWINPVGFISIGASTAVFAGLGLLAGYGQARRDIAWRPGLRRWAPLGAGVMLLAFLGFGGEEVDIVAHVTGFAVGVGGGLWLARRDLLGPPDPVRQSRAGIAAAGLVGISWVVALS